MSALEYDAHWPRCVRCECFHREASALAERNGLLLCADQAKCTATIRERLAAAEGAPPPDRRRKP